MLNNAGRGFFPTLAFQPVTARRVLAAGTAVLAVVAVFATGPARGADLKVGYVNVVRVVDEAPQGEKARKRLEAEFRPRDQELVETRAKIRKLESKLEKTASELGDDERRDKERQLVSLRRHLRRASQEFREDYNLRRNEELGELQKVVYKVIVEIAKAEGYDLVLHEGAIFASDNIDITDKVLKKLRKQ